MLCRQQKSEVSENLLKEAERLCDPEQMGEIYKVLFAAHSQIGEVFPFFFPETMKNYS
jgi:SAM-dependent MidA family methyltransferase